MSARVVLVITGLAILGCSGLDDPTELPPEVTPPPADEVETPERGGDRARRGGRSRSKAGAGRGGHGGRGGDQARRDGRRAPPDRSRPPTRGDGRPDAPVPDPILTDGQRRNFVWWLDEMCGDRWCSGPNDYRFDAVTCDGHGTCELALQFMPWNDEDRWRPARCTIRDIDQASDLVQTREEDLPTDHALAQVGDCLDQL